MKLPLFNFIDGVNTNVSPFLVKPTELTVLNGANCSYKLGALLKDTGYFRVSTQIQANKSITGLFNFIQDDATQKMLATVDDSTSDDTQLFYKTEGGAWTEITTAETAWANFAGINVEMESFIGYCFFVGYGATDGFLPVLSLTGTTTSTSTNVTNMPKAKFIKRYRDRLYVLNCQISSTSYPYRTYYSSVPSAGAITWTQATDFFDIDFSDSITGAGVAFDRLVIFTKDKTYFYDQAQKKQVFEVGCSNHRTIQEHSSYLIWCSTDGVWMSTSGQPQNVSGKIIDLIRGANPLNFFSALVDEEYHLYLGDTSADGVSYTKVVATYNIPTNTWRWRELYSTMTIFAEYSSVATGQRRLYMGDSAGNVWDKSKYIDSTIYGADEVIVGSSTGQEITSNVEFAPLVFDSWSTIKDLDNLVAYANRAQGVHLKARVLNRNSKALTPYKPIGTLTGYINPFQIDVDKGEILQLALSENSKNPYWSFYGVELSVEKDSDTFYKQK